MPRARNVTRLAPKPALIRSTDGLPLRLRLAGAHQPREEGFVGVDGVKTDSVDYVVDLKVVPWPVADDSVDTMFAAHYLQRLDMGERIAFMNEAHRVLKVGAQLILVVPHWSHRRAAADPRAKWPPINELSFYYFNKGWREAEKYDEGITCDFDWGYGHTLDVDVAQRNREYQDFARKHYVNAILDLHVTMTKR
jgi:SAM-dependent methyltransferase